MNGSRRDVKRFPRAESHRRLPVLRKDDGSFQNVTYLVARVGMSTDFRTGLKLSHGRNKFSARGRSIALLQYCPLKPGLLSAP